MALESIWGYVRPYVPNLLAIVFIIALTRLVLGSLSKILQLLYKHFSIPRGYYLKVRAAVKFLIIVVAVFAILLFIPGVDEKVVALVGLGMGVLVSLSSTTTIGNAVAGAILYMTRPIREGDRVEIGGVLGDVVRLELLFVHLKTIKDEIVSVPSLQVLNGKIINYTQLDKVILHVDQTLGYDLDPGVVEDLLLAAAKKTDGILDDPEPFILIRALHDYTVEYELNGYTDNPQAKVQLESNMRRNIISEFTRAGVQIMSPSYVNVMHIPCEGKIMPQHVTGVETKAADEVKEEHEKKIAEAKQQLEEKKQEDIKLKEK